jgi:hypothetical protein
VAPGLAGSKDMAVLKETGLIIIPDIGKMSRIFFENPGFFGKSCREGCF